MIERENEIEIGKVRRKWDKEKKNNVCYGGLRHCDPYASREKKR